MKTSVSNIQTRIDTIDQVLHALLYVASEQLTSTAPRIPNNNSIGTTGLFNDVNRHPKNQYRLESSPLGIQTVPALLSGTDSRTGRSTKAEDMVRTTSHLSEFRSLQSNCLEGSLEMGTRRRGTDPQSSIQPSFLYRATVSGPGRRESAPLGNRYHENIDIKQKGKQKPNKEPNSPLSQSRSTALNWQSPKPQRKVSVDLVGGDENPIDVVLRKQAESNEAQYIPIEHWITAAMHWYFKASNYKRSKWWED